MSAFLVRVLLFGWGAIRGARAVWAAGHHRRADALGQLAAAAVLVSMAALA